MYKKTLLSVAVASALTLTGCLDNNNERPSDTENSNTFTNPGTQDVVGYAMASYPVFSPATGDFPIPNDMLIQKDSTATDEIEQSDGSYAIPGSDATDATPPVVALENLSGASLTAPIDIEVKVGVNPTNGSSLGIDSNTIDARSFIMSGSTPVPNPTQTVFLIELEYASDNPLQALSNREKPTASLGITAALAQAGDLTAGAALAGLAATPTYDAEVITRTKDDGSTGTYIRINPLTPLNPNKRYIVALTNEITDGAGTPLVRHPGAAAYEALSDTTKGLASTALAPVQALVNDLWEAVTVGYFGLNNTTRAGASLSSLSEENIIFSISFTTSNDTKVVDYMVEPNTWITDTIKSLVKTGAAKAATEAGAADYTATKATVDAAYDAWMAADFSPLLAGCDAAFPSSADSRFKCAGDNLEAYLVGEGLSFPKPTADTSITFANHRDLRTVSAAITDAIATAGTVNISEGNMSIPYYSGVPTTRGVSDGTEVNLVNEWWKSDATLATGINTAFNLDALGSPLPQGVPSDSNTVRSTVVNGIYPFPQKNSDEEIPVLAIYPASDANKPANGYKTIIYQHGITTDRSVALTLGSAIVANSGGTVAVLAIDQPLHGIDAESDAGKAIWAETFLAGAGFLSSADGTNDGLDDDVADQASIDAVVTGGGAFATPTATNVVLGIQATCPNISITNPANPDATELSTAIGLLTTTGGAVCDGLGFATVLGAEPSVIVGGAYLIESTVANSASQIPGLGQGSASERHFGFGGVNLAPVPMNFTTGNVGSSPNSTLERVNTGSGSMTINPGNFLTSRDNFRQQIVDLMTLRLSIPTMDIDGTAGADLDTDNVHFIGHSLGTLNGIPFVEIANQTETTADNIVSANFLTPGGNIARLTENSQVFAPSVLLGLKAAADLDRGDADLEAFLNALQAAFDSFDPINFVGNFSSTTSTTKALFTEVVGDAYIPNSADPAIDVVQPTRLTVVTNNGDGTITQTPMANPYGGISMGVGTDAPLAGTDPLQTISGATTIGNAGANALSINFQRFESTSGALHTTPVAAATAGEVPAFAEIVGQATSIVATDGAAVVITDDTLIVDP